MNVHLASRHITVFDMHTNKEVVIPKYNATQNMFLFIRVSRQRFADETAESFFMRQHDVFMFLFIFLFVIFSIQLQFLKKTNVGFGFGEI